MGVSPMLSLLNLIPPLGTCVEDNHWHRFIISDIYFARKGPETHSLRHFVIIVNILEKDRDFVRFFKKLQTDGSLSTFLIQKKT